MIHIYEVRPRKDRRGFDLISDALPFGGLWYAGPNAVAKQSHTQSIAAARMIAVLRVCDESGNVIETHEHTGEFKEW